MRPYPDGGGSSGASWPLGSVERSALGKTAEKLEQVQMRAINIARALGVVLCDKRANKLEMFSLTTKALRREVSAVFKHLEGCHTEEGRTLHAPRPQSWR